MQAQEGLADPAGRSNNLPILLNRFIGRARELAEVERLLAASRLLTLTGPGGCGKTRLAVETGHRLQGLYRDGAWLADFSQISDGSQLIAAIARVLGVVAGSGQPLESVLVDYLRHRELLLILDNCEHVAAEAARAAGAILSAGAGGLSILATSQAPLGVPGEVEWLVPSLDMPEAGQEPVDIASLKEYSAPRLFLERATEIQPGFALQDAQALVLVQICRRLDGIPLAIELAAARVKMFSIEEIAARLNDRFALLSSSRRVAGRHQTLQAAIDWSYHLLEPRMQALLCRLAVFSGPWTVASAEAVCGYGDIPREAVLGLLAGLVDRSLVVVLQPGSGANLSGESRYRLLETIRLYGLARLPAGELDGLRERHLLWYTRSAQEASQHIHGPEQEEWYARLDTDLPNFLAAMEWAAGFPAPHPRLLAGLQLAAGLGWYSRGRMAHSTVCAWMEKLVELAGETPGDDWTAARAEANFHIAFFFFRSGQSDKVDRYLEASLGQFASLGEAGLRGYAYALQLQGLGFSRVRMASAQKAAALFRQLGDAWGEALALLTTGIQMLDRTKGEQGNQFLEKSLNIFRRLGDGQMMGLSSYNLGYYYLHQERDAEALAYSLETDRLLSKSNLLNGKIRSLFLKADIAMWQGRYREAESLYWEVIPAAEKIGYASDQLDVYLSLGRLRLFEERFSEAREYLLKVFQMIRDGFMQNAEEIYVYWQNLYFLAAAVSAQDPELAARMSGKALGEIKGRNIWFSHRDAIPADKILEAVKTRMGEARFRAAQREGEYMTLDALLAGLPLEEPVSVVPAEPSPRKTSPRVTPLRSEKARFSGLTAREREIAARIVQGETNAAIARKLQLSERTVTTHVSHILNKLGYSSRSQIAAWAVEKGLVST